MKSIKSTPIRHPFIQILSIALFFLLFRIAYLITITDKSFISRSQNFGIGIGTQQQQSSAIITEEESNSKEWRNLVNFYSSRFQDLISEGLISRDSKALCVETQRGEDVFALKEIGVNDSIGTFNKGFLPLVRFARVLNQPFGNSSFDFVFSGNGGIDQSARPFEYANEIGRVLRNNGVVVVHTNSAKDMYSFKSFLGLFSCCSLVGSRKIDYLGFKIEEIVLKKVENLAKEKVKVSGKTVDKCSVPDYKMELIRNAEPLIKEEPLKPWITLKRNVKNVNYLPSIVDISFKRKYVYIDVGARSYGSSIGSWFRKQYPKQNKTFEIYAIEADKAFHEEYKTKKNVVLLPFAAWLRNETLFFEINRDPVQKTGEKRRGMGRIQTVQSSFDFMGDVDKIRGFDFANWLNNTVSEKDFVVMKMDVEGTEFDLIPKLFETGAICLVDEIFLECHYNRWQRCCPGKRSPKYRKTYAQCLELFSSLRKSGILVHQWW
ncbi:hypothetical protein ACHQM5_013516 [Ranunculus cassubicifolius]